jgi:hypothetical protein
MSLPRAACLLLLIFTTTRGYSFINLIRRYPFLMTTPPNRYEIGQITVLVTENSTTILREPGDYDFFIRSE